jgi:hypothetical protein
LLDLEAGFWVGVPHLKLRNEWETLKFSTPIASGSGLPGQLRFDPRKILSRESRGTHTYAVRRIRVDLTHDMQEWSHNARPCQTVGTDNWYKSGFMSSRTGSCKRKLHHLFNFIVIIYTRTSQ